MEDLVAVILAAGAGSRLRPLTDIRPKALCPVANIALLDLGLERVAPHVNAIAVNAHHLHEQIVAHLRIRAAAGLHVSVEQPEALGTAGALGRLRDWIDGRPVVVTNADAWTTDDLVDLVHGWDGQRARLLTVHDPARGDFGDARYAGACLLPWRLVRGLEATPAGLYERVWAGEEEAGRLDLHASTAPFIDCGTPRDYLGANLAASGGASVVGEGAAVEGELVRSVVWPGGRVAPGERLVECIRVGERLTVAAPQG